VSLSAHTLSWPPTSQTVKEMFLYCTVSTLNPDQREESELWENEVEAIELSSSSTKRTKPSTKREMRLAHRLLESSSPPLLALICTALSSCPLRRDPPLKCGNLLRHHQALRALSKITNPSPRRPLYPCDVASHTG